MVAGAKCMVPTAGIVFWLVKLWCADLETEKFQKAEYVGYYEEIPPVGHSFR
jgi:hypothetical protein